jgi:hypothetical protein
MPAFIEKNFAYLASALVLPVIVINAARRSQVARNSDKFPYQVFNRWIGVNFTAATYSDLTFSTLLKIIVTPPPPKGQSEDQEDAQPRPKRGNPKPNGRERPMNQPAEAEAKAKAEKQWHSY